MFYNNHQTESQLRDVNMEELEQTIMEILHDAEIKHPIDINDAILELCTAYSYIDELNNEDETRKLVESIRNDTLDRVNAELQYLSRKAKILYEIRKYELALEELKKIEKKIPSNSKIYLEIGDCYRK